MRIYGYGHKELHPYELAEITLNATPEELRKIARFMESVADGIDKRGSEFSHEHLSDAQPGFEDSPHFVIYNLEATS